MKFVCQGKNQGSRDKLVEQARLAQAPRRRAPELLQVNVAVDGNGRKKGSRNASDGSRPSHCCAKCGIVGYSRWTGVHLCMRGLQSGALAEPVSPASVVQGRSVSAGYKKMFTGRQQRNKQTLFPIAQRQIGRAGNEAEPFFSSLFKNRTPCRNALTRLKRCGNGINR
jgi:hypothetical protein